METITVRYKKLDTLFQDLKLTGNSNVHLKRPRGLFGKNRWREAIKHYEALKDSEVYPATVEIIYGHAWKAEEQEEKAGNEVFVSINSIR